MYLDDPPPEQGAVHATGTAAGSCSEPFPLWIFQFRKLMLTTAVKKPAPVRRKKQEQAEGVRCWPVPDTRTGQKTGRDGQQLHPG